MIMSREQVLDSIFALLDRVLPHDVPVSEQTALVDELGLDSSAALSMLLELEESLDMHIPAVDFYSGDVKTVGELADLIVAAPHADPPVAGS